MKKMKEFIVSLVRRCFEDDLLGGAAQMAYPLIIAIIPLIMFTITLASRINLPIDDIYAYLQFLLPAQAYGVVKSLLSEILTSGSLTVPTLIPTIYFIAMGARGVMKGLNRSYKQTENRNMIKIWILSFIFAVLFSLLIAISFGIVVFGELLGKWAISLLGIDLKFSIVWRYLRIILSFGGLGLILSIIYMVAPNVRLTLKQVYKGAYFAAFGWITASVFFGYYVNNFSNYGVIFGSLGGVFILLVWVYLSSAILLLGGEVNAILYAKQSNH